MTLPQTPADALGLFYDLLAARGGGAWEIRAFLPARGSERTYSGYYTDRQTFVEDALDATDRGASGVYATVNPTLDALRARGENRLAPAKRGGATKDAEVERRLWLVFDFDPVRPTGISATAGEKGRARERARAVVAYLRSRGWPDPVVIDSGNGVHLYYPIDLPADDAGLVALVLSSVAAGYSDDEVEVDTSVSNASRVMKAPGTWARKGDDAEARPHRRAAFLQLPDWTDRPPDEWPVVTRRQLEAEAALAPTSGDFGIGPGDDPDDVGAALEAVAAHYGRPARPLWLRLCASTKAACAGDTALAKTLLVGAFGEEEPGEYEPVLSSTFDRIGRGTLFYHARVAGWTRPKRTRRERREHQRAGRVRDRHRAEPPDSSVPLGVCVADVEPEAVRWMWDGRLARGKVHLLDGDPGGGKSTITAGLTASVTAGVPWPDGEAVPDESRGAVVYVTAEDDVATTIRTRLEAAGADVRRVSVVSLVPTASGAGRMPVLPDDVEAIMGECRRIGARLVIFDPVTAYLGDANSHRDADVRATLAPLAEAAERAGVAVLLIRHLNKGSGGSALYRGGGSIAFAGLARIVMVAGRVPDDPTGERRALAVSKNNLARFAPTLGYHIESSGPFAVGRVVWHGPVPLSADDLVRPPSSGSSTPAQDDAADFLLDTLAAGPRLAREVYAEAEAAGITERTLKRAKARLGVEAERRGGAGGSGAWYWIGPESKGAKDPDPGPLSDVSGDGAAGTAPGGPQKPKGATPVAPLDGVAPLADRGPLSGAVEIEAGATVRTPRGLGVVAAPPAGGEISVEVDGLPFRFPLAEVSSVPPPDVPF